MSHIICRAKHLEDTQAGPSSSWLHGVEDLNRSVNLLRFPIPQLDQKYSLQVCQEHRVGHETHAMSIWNELTEHSEVSDGPDNRSFEEVHHVNVVRQDHYQSEVCVMTNSLPALFTRYW